MTDFGGSDELREPAYIRRSRFIKGLEHPDLIGYLQSEAQSGRLVVLDDDVFMERFPDAE